MMQDETGEPDDNPAAGNGPRENELLSAAWEGDAERVNELVALGAELECFNENGATPLHLAIENQNLDVVRLLLDAGADVNRRTAEGYWTPLAHACDVVCDAASQLGKKPDNALLRLLIDNGADVNARISDGLTPLELVRKYLNREAEGLLVSAGAERRSGF